MNKKGQTSFEFIFILVIVILLVVVVFASFPKNNSEIVALGIVKSNLGGYLMQNNYTGNYNLESNIKDSNIDISIIFSQDFDLKDYNKILINKIKENLNFENVKIDWRNQNGFKK